MDDKSVNFPVQDDPGSVRTLRIWRCRYSTLAPVARLENLEGMAILALPDATLEWVSGLTRLRYLSIVHLPRIRDLGPLASLSHLSILSLQTLPSWDSSGKRQVVDSLEPLTRLQRLKHLELLGVVPADSSPRPLAGIASLKTVRLHGFGRKTQAEFFGTSPVLNEFAPRPEF